MIEKARELLFTAPGRLVSGQILAFLMSCTGVFTTLLVNDGASFPLLQAIVAYLAISIVFLPKYIQLYVGRWGQGGTQPLEFSNFAIGDRLWRYGIIAIADLEANYLIVKAYQYTNMTSVQLLDCFTIPCVMLLSLVVLSARFSTWQLGGALVAISGIALLIVLDADGMTRTSDAPNVVLGDVLCLASSACYAMSNVACEKLIKVSGGIEGTAGADSEVPQQREVPSSSQLAAEGSCGYRPSAGALPMVPSWIPVLEYLAVMPTIALVLATCQFVILELHDLRDFSPQWTAVDTAYLVSYALTMVLIYAGMPLIFYISSATFANLSLLSSDIYSIIFNVTVFATNPKPTFFLAYVVIVGGIAAYDTDGFKKVRERFSLFRYNAIA